MTDTGRQQALKMIQDGKISAEQGLVLLVSQPVGHSFLEVNAIFASNKLTEPLLVDVHDDDGEHVQVYMVEESCDGNC